jgi:transposase, IS5 family
VIKREHGQISFYSHIYDAVIPKDHLLRLIEEAVDFEYVNETCEGLYCTDNGRPGYNPLMMFKITFLEFLYTLSDRDVMEALQINLAYKWFVGLDVIETVPDATSLTKFRNRLGAVKFKELFNGIVEQARTKGLITDRLHIIDSTHIEARVDLFRLKDEYQINEDDNKYVDRNTPDRDARFGKKEGKKAKTFYGYKEHAGIDADSELFTAIEVSAGNAHDGQYLEAVINGDPDILTADKAYDTDNNHKHLKERQIRDALIRKSNRHYGVAVNIAYGHDQRERPKIERRFADQKKNHGLRECRYWGLLKTKIQCYMTAIVCNCKRIVVLIKQMEVPDLAIT